MEKKISPWRQEPYRLFFPLGLLLAWGGILHWQLHALGILSEFRPVFHSITQIQGFMICFALGFLFTAIPRRTGTPPPAGWQMGVCGASAVGTSIAAWFQMWALSQMFWILLIGTFASFAIGRFRAARSGRRPPNSFLWIPISFGMGLCGSVLIGTYGLLGPGYFQLHEFGKLILLQGMFLGLVVGVGGLVFPLITQGEGPPDGAGSTRDRWERLVHLLGAVLLIASFWLENYVTLVGGLLLRAAVLLAILIGFGGIHRVPRVAGWHRWLVWFSAWMVPIGYLVAALFPEEKVAGLHVVFIGGFALMAFSVGIHVTLAHGGALRLLTGRPWQVPVFGALLFLSIGFRLLVGFDRNRFFLWIGAAAAAFLLASLVWLSLTFSWWWAPPDQEKIR